MPIPFRRLLLSLVFLLPACSAAPGPTAKTLPPPKTPAPQFRAAPEPAPAPPAQATTTIVMGTPLPGVPMPVTPPPRPALPKPAEAASFGPSPVAAAPTQMLPSGPAAPTAPVGTPPTGYAGIDWGRSVKSVQGLTAKHLEPSLGMTTYLWLLGPKTIFGAPVRDTLLSFFKGEFYHVWIDLDGKHAYEAALAGLTAAYGPPTSENLQKFYHAWNLANVNIYCAYHPDEDEGDVSFFYQPIYERLDALRTARIRANKARKP